MCVYIGGQLELISQVNFTTEEKHSKIINKCRNRYKIYSKYSQKKMPMNIYKLYEIRGNIWGI